MSNLLDDLDKAFFWDDFQNKIAFGTGFVIAIIAIVAIYASAFM